jgi:formate dehydrogenase major subunit
LLRVTIDGRPHDLPDGISVLEGLRRTGIEVPTLCHDDRLEPYGGCRLCIVEIAGFTRPATACTTPLANGMSIATRSEAIEELRRSLLALLASRYPVEALRAEEPAEQGDQEFHRYLRDYGLLDRVAGAADPGLVDDSHPNIHVDMSRCVYCYRCVRICNELQGQFVWRVWSRGEETRIRPDGPDLLHSSCVSCGACVDTCPSGALEDKALLLGGAPTRWERTTCPYCGTGCEMSVGTRAGRITAVRPVLDAGVSKGHLCAKGRYAFEFASAADRVTTPMLRQRGVWTQVSWDAAIRHVAERLTALRDRHGADSLAVLGSARATNEENYVAQKFARVVLGTNNVDCCARVCHTPSAAALKSMLGAGAATNSFDDIERASAILICGANPTENHPIVGARIRQAVLAGAALIVIDPRRIELARHAECYLPVRPGRNIPLLNAMASTILDENLYDHAFLDQRVQGLAPFAEAVAAWPAERAAAICGVAAEEIRRAARLYATRRPAMAFHGLGVTEHVQGTAGVMALVNLALLTGNLGVPGAGVNPLRGQNNVQGAAHMGCDRGVLTGGASIADRDARRRVEGQWGVPLPANRGLHLLEMFDAAIAARLKAMWLVGYDVLLTLPRAETTARALESLELLIVQDLFLNQTAAASGSVFLPACSSFEKDGTFMNSDRRVQRVRRVIAPLGEARTDWEIFCAVARAMGREREFPYRGAEEIWNEIRAVWSDGAGISYARLEHGGIQWPCPSDDHPGTAVLHRDRFAIGARATLRTIDYQPTPEAPTDEFPLLLTTGRTLHQFNAGTMSRRSPNAVLRPTDLLDVSPVDARRLEIASGDLVRLISRYGHCEIRARVDESIQPGQLFATFHDPDVFLNQVTGPHRDRDVGSPEYKVTAVRIERL